MAAIERIAAAHHSQMLVVGNDHELTVRNILIRRGLIAAGGDLQGQVGVKADLGVFTQRAFDIDGIHSGVVEYIPICIAVNIRIPAERDGALVQAGHHRKVAQIPGDAAAGHLKGTERQHSTGVAAIVAGDAAAGHVEGLAGGIAHTAAALGGTESAGDIVGDSAGIQVERAVVVHAAAGITHAVILCDAAAVHVEGAVVLHTGAGIVPVVIIVIRRAVAGDTAAVEIEGAARRHRHAAAIGAAAVGDGARTLAVHDVQGHILGHPYGVAVDMAAGHIQLDAVTVQAQHHVVVFRLPPGFCRRRNRRKRHIVFQVEMLVSTGNDTEPADLVHAGDADPLRVVKTLGIRRRVIADVLVDCAAAQTVAGVLHLRGLRRGRQKTQYRRRYCQQTYQPFLFHQEFLLSRWNFAVCISLRLRCVVLLAGLRCGLGGALAGLGVLRPGADAEQLVCGLLDDLAVHDAVPPLLIQWFDSDRWPAAVFCGSP